MDVATAYALVGVERGAATMPDAKTAFRSRSKLLHPDRADSSTSSAAERAMSQLTEAWTIVQHDMRGERGEQETDERWRAPGAGECDVCGWAPAAPIVLRRTVGRVLFWRWYQATADACRVCARSLYAEHQATSLVYGWWGILAPFANVVNMTRNRLALAGHRRMVSRPKSHDGRVASLSGPLEYRSPWTRPVGLGTSLAALILFAALGTGWVNHVNNTAPARSSTPAYVAPPVAGVGGCLDASGLVVECADPSAAWSLASQVATADDCAFYPESFTDSSGDVFCANPR